MKITEKKTNLSKNLAGIFFSLSILIIISVCVVPKAWDAKDLNLFIFKNGPTTDLNLLLDTGYGFNPDQIWKIPKAQNANSVPMAFNIDKTTTLDVSGPIESWVSIDRESPISVNVQKPGFYKLSIPPEDFESIFFIGSNEKNFQATLHFANHTIPSNRHEGIQALEVIRKNTDVTVRWSSAVATVSRWDIDENKVLHVKLLGSDLQSLNSKTKLIQASDDFWNLKELVAYEEDTYNVDHLTNKYPTGTLLFISILVCLSSLVFSLIALKLPIRSIVLRIRFAKKDLISLVFVFGYFAFFYLAWAPGMSGADSLSPPIQASTGSFSIWYGLGVPVLTTALNLIFDHTALLLLQCFMHASIVWLSFHFVKEYLNKYLGAIFLMLLLLFTTAGSMSAYLYRDSISGILVFATLLLLWRYLAIIDKHQEQFTVEIILLTLGLILITLRQDNLIFFVGIAVAIIFKNNNFRAYKRVLLSCLLATVISMGPSILFSNFQIEQRNYQVVAIINGLGSIVHDEKYEGKDSEKTASIISPIIPFNILKDQWTPYNVVYWHLNGNMQPSEEQVAHLRSLYGELVYKNFPKWLNGRLQTFASTLEAKEFTIFPGDYSSASINLVGLKNWGYFREKSTGLTDTGLKILDLQKTISTSVPQTALILFFLFWFAKLPATSFVSALLTLKLVAMFVFAPASVFSYAYDVHLFGFLIPFLALIEWRKSKTDLKSHKIGEAKPWKD